MVSTPPGPDPRLATRYRHTSGPGRAASVGVAAMALVAVLAVVAVRFVLGGDDTAQTSTLALPASSGSADPSPGAPSLLPVTSASPTAGSPSATASPSAAGRATAAKSATTTSTSTPARTKSRASTATATSSAARTPSSAAPTTAGGAGSEAAWAQEVLRLTNVERAGVGCRALVWNAALGRAAQLHSEDMRDRGYFGHDTPEGLSPFDRMRAQGYRFHRAAENIAAGQPSPAAVVAAWMGSSGHRANIVDCRLTELGVGVAVGGSYRVYWTQDFGTP